MSFLKSLFSDKKNRDQSPAFLDQGYAPVTRDTVAAIDELSRVVKNNPDAVEIYLALGNLYRSQGEIERAVQIRQNLIVRPGLDKNFKAKALYELGLDYKRGGFLDRSMNAFEKARQIAGNLDSINAELARIHAESGEFEKAAGAYAQLGAVKAEAHYLVRVAQEEFAKGDEGQGWKWINRAIKVYPGSPEARIEAMIQAYRKKQWESLAEHMNEGLEKTPDRLAFVLPEGLLQSAQTQSGKKQDELPFQFQPDAELCDTVLPVLEKRELDLLLQFYAAWIASGRDLEKSREMLERTLVLSPGFWPARLELLAIGLKDQPLSSSFASQLEFFIHRARQVKRFLCRQCGLKRERIFFVCPRCHSWHSIGYRTVLNE
jgi:lipopolysaccharide biosynthesis regulator YciM